MTYSDKLLEAILEEITKMHLDVHYHLDRMEIFYKMVHNIKEDKETGAWIEESDKK